EGQGGCTFLDPLNPVKSTRPLLEEAERFAKSLPPVKTRFKDPQTPKKDFIISVTLEFLVDDLAGRMHEEKKLRAAFNRDIANKVLFVVDDELRYLKKVKLRGVPDRAKLFQELRQRNPSKQLTILAELPQEEAYTLWKRHMLREQGQEQEHASES